MNNDRHYDKQDNLSLTIATKHIHLFDTIIMKNTILHKRLVSGKQTSIKSSSASAVNLLVLGNNCTSHGIDASCQGQWDIIKRGYILVDLYKNMPWIADVQDY